VAKQEGVLAFHVVLEAGV